MKRLVLTALVFIMSMHLNAQSPNPKYDKALADTLKGDDYGMKMYVLVILKTGTAKIDNKPTVDSLFAGHLANIRRLASEGKLIVAGPLGKNEKGYRGIFIFNMKSIDEVNTIIQSTDPAIKAKLLDVELYPWYGSAALPVYLKAHEKIEKKLMQ